MHENIRIIIIRTPEDVLAYRAIPYYNGCEFNPHYRIEINSDIHKEYAGISSSFATDTWKTEKSFITLHSIFDTMPPQKH